MDALYSIGLMLSLVSAAAALTIRLGAVALIRTSRRLHVAFIGSRSMFRYKRTAVALVWTSLISALVSLAVHLQFGHRPGTENAMSAVRFAIEHPVYSVVGLFLAAALGLARLAEAMGRPKDE